jgi:DNA polymerase III epsilon subunit-like protein
MYLVYDLETSGLPERKGFNKFYSYKDNSKYDSSRIVQVAWKVIKDKEPYEEVCFKDYIIKRNGFEINNSRFHGITNEISDNGTEFKVCMKDFIEDLKLCHTIVAHNISFDYNVLLNHLYRFAMKSEIKLMQSKKQFCTMLNSKNILKIPLVKGHNVYKATSLNEVYFYYYKQDIDHAHNAYYDVDACAKCLVKLLGEKSLIKKKKKKERE